MARVARGEPTVVSKRFIGIAVAKPGNTKTRFALSSPPITHEDFTLTLNRSFPFGTNSLKGEGVEYKSEKLRWLPDTHCRD